MRNIVSDIFTWSWFSEPHGYNFNGHLVCNPDGNICIDPVELTEDDMDTLIGEGTKIDNLVQIAHNVVIGKHCIIVAQNGIGGSTQIGEYSTLGGQVGILGHITIGPKAMIAAKSTVLNNLEGGKQYMGFPAIPNFQAKRQLIAAQQLPELIKRVRELEKQLANKDKPAADDA